MAARLPVAAAIATCVLGLAAGAHGDPTGAIQVSKPWTRATAAPGSTAAVYATITNHGGTPDRLTGAACPVAQSTEIHQDTNENGIMRMRPVDGIDIPPGHTLTLAPNGYHLMLVGTKQRLTRGSTITCTLQFRDAGPVGIELPVRAAGAAENMMGPMEMQ
ncbi:MAG: copper chaperone PCu(A)C [Alphaproteobacteria bacterium]|nr:copper chaperone PCu(A)C [Alphaproteobacteria bacterium]